MVVVGYGGAGAYAAISAYDAGAKVLILEKTPSLAALGVANNKTFETEISGGGGNTHICGGNTDSCSDPVSAATFFYYSWFGQTPMKVCQAFAEMYAQNGAYMHSLGLTYNYPGTSRSVEYGTIWPGGATAGWTTVTPPNAGRQLFHDLDQLVTVTRGIPVLFSTRGTGLIQNPTTGEVLGVQALQNESQVVTVQANRAVVLTTGSFEYDGVMKANYLGLKPCHLGGWQYNTGDGVKMALKAGAGLWHMTSIGGRLGTWEPTHNMGGAFNTPSNNWIWTDRYGNRFAGETGLPSHSTWKVATEWNFTYGEFSRVPTMLIFDSKMYNAGPVFGYEGGVANGGGAVPVQLGGWGSNGNFTGSAAGTAWTNDALVAAGIIFKGQDIPTLAANIASATIIGSNQGMATPPGWNASESMDNVTLPQGTSCPHFSAANLTAAINQWNNDVAAGKGDTVFGRAPSTMAAISTPPYYALPLWPEGPNVNGGPIRDEMARVCDPDYNPIPRLYSAGELGSVFAEIYSGSNLGEVCAFGRIAGNNAAAENPWTS